jgi:S1-C subfamily serine protease
VDHEHAGARAGFQKGDVIIAVDDKPAAEFSLAMLKTVFAAEGTHHTFGIVRKPEPVELAATVEQVPLSSLR